MSTRKAIDGLVLREMQSGENDRLILVLTAEEGKMWITAKGGRSIRSKLASVCRIFTYANLEFYEKNNRRWLSGGSVNNSFYGINSDIEGFSLASYVLQLADEITGENAEAREILRTTLNTLYAIENKLKPYAQIKAAYELFAASVSGFSPDLSACTDCGRSELDDSNSPWLDVMNGAIVCSECLHKRSGQLPLPELDAFETRNILVPLDSSALMAMRYISSAPSQRLFAFRMTDGRSLSILEKATETYILNHLERDFDTLHFYNSVK